MKVVITGGSGFLGNRLAHNLLKLGELINNKGKAKKISKIVIIDKFEPSSPFNDKKIDIVTGDIGAKDFLKKHIDSDTSTIFHLAAVVSSQAEQDFELGMRVNLDSTRNLLDVCRALNTTPKLVFTSSVAVFGGNLPKEVQDHTAVNPQSSYGCQKAIGELLINDYSRRGFIDGRIFRLPTISVRPGKPNKAASSFASGIIREPLNNQNSVCPVSPDMGLWLLSPRQVVNALIHGHNLSAEKFGLTRIVNLPGISVKVEEMLKALKKIAGKEKLNYISLEKDALVERIVGSWPQAWNTSRAKDLGFVGDQNFEEIIKAYIEDDLK